MNVHIARNPTSMDVLTKILLLAIGIEALLLSAIPQAESLASRQLLATNSQASVNQTFVASPGSFNTRAPRTTKSSTTFAPKTTTTQRPKTTTQRPTTTTQRPKTTTQRPKTTTQRPTTQRPTTTTQRPTTQRPTTQRPTTTTQRPTTQRPTTQRPTTATQRPTTQRPTAATQRPVSRLQLQLRCANAGRCLFDLQPPLTSFRSSLVLLGQKPDWCNETEAVTKRCCTVLKRDINSLNLTVPSSNVQRIKDFLTKKNCPRLYCTTERCTHVECNLTSCDDPATPTLPSSSPSSPLTSDVTGPQTGKNGDSTSNPGEKTARTTTIIIVVVSCVVAFLAGIGGAFLITCLRKRWGTRKGSDSGDPDSRNTAGRELNALPVTTGLSETQTHALRPHPNAEYCNTARASANEHVYSCINDHQLIKKHNPATEKPSPASSWNSFPASHLPDRKLPSAPTLPEPPLPLAEEASRDNDARARCDTLGEFSYVKKPEIEGETPVNKTSLGADRFSEIQPAAGEYFLLEKEDEEQREERVSDVQEQQQQGMYDNRTETSQDPPPEYFTLEREEPEGEEELTAMHGRDTSPANHPREGIPSFASDSGECYSPLDLSRGRSEDSEYTALDLSDVEKSDVEASRDYLEVVPDYVLAAPVK
ncbi:uncharacterized protein LOC143291070 isoform X3 [Babylonia areolata]|uniref:uncharacterized protein LOC143291070 isoform X3 n=1 Tax=Babylonia areolata TaxID=304850 RepID=UPI003FD511CF